MNKIRRIDQTKIDQIFGNINLCPIYILNLSSGGTTVNAVGNFRHYMEALLNSIINYEGNALIADHEVEIPIYGETNSELIRLKNLIGDNEVSHW